MLARRTALTVSPRSSSSPGRGWWLPAAALCLVGAACATVWALGQRRHAAQQQEQALLERRIVFLAADGAQALYQLSANRVHELEDEIAKFSAAPTTLGLERVRAAWANSREPYMQSEVFRFWNGPIDAVEVWLNTWPVDESVLESEDGRHGLLDCNDEELTAARLVELNMRGGETSVTTGFHAIEFVLWGKDTSLEGPGSRGADAFLPSDARAGRRLQFLRVTSRLLGEQLEQLARDWAPDANNFRKKFLEEPPRRAIGRLLRGFGTLAGGEIAGERLTVPLLTRDPENEHSCFSDATAVDLRHNAEGLWALCEGAFRSSDRPGAGLCALGDSSFRAQVTQAVRLTRALPDPLDRALTLPDDSPQRRAAFAARDAWRTVSESTAQLLDEFEGLP